LGTKLDNAKHFTLAIAHLHNFCINEQLLENVDADPAVEERATGCSTEDDLSSSAVEIDALAHEAPGWSEVRDKMDKKN
jgi:hypothetical protein